MKKQKSLWPALSLRIQTCVYKVRRGGGSVVVQWSFDSKAPGSIPDEKEASDCEG